MPGVSFLGTRPQGENKASQTAEAMGKLSDFGFAQEERIRGRESDKTAADILERETQIKEGEFQYKLDNLDYSKKVEAATLMTKVIASLPEDKRSELIDDPEIQALYNSAGVPLPSKPTTEEPLPESWEDVGILGRAKAAITPTKTKEEKALGGLRPGGIVQPPKTKKWPDNVTEEEIQHTMKTHGLTRRELLEKIGV